MRQHWKYIVLSLAIGLFIGTTGTFFTLHYRSHHDWSPRMAGGMRSQLYKDLALSQDQKVRLDMILGASREKMKAIRESSRDEIRKILTPDQQSKFDELNRRMDERRRHMMDRPPRRVRD